MTLNTLARTCAPTPTATPATTRPSASPRPPRLQVWAQAEFNSQADVEIGDSVTVRRGALGSYLLVTKAKIGTRVKRVK